MEEGLFAMGERFVAMEEGFVAMEEGLVAHSEPSPKKPPVSFSHLHPQNLNFTLPNSKRSLNR